LKKKLLIIALGIFILTSAIAIADYNETDLSPIGSANLTNRSVYVLDHTNNPEEGNWITMETPSGGREIRLPKEIKIGYSGPKYMEYNGASGNLFKNQDDTYTINYPSTSSYLNYPVYLPGENVSMSFHGQSDLEGDVNIYLFKVPLSSIYGILDVFKAGAMGNLEDGNLKNFLDSNMNGIYQKYSAVLKENGDLLDYDLGPLDAGQYCTVMLQENEDGSRTVLSAMPFMVSEYELCASAPSNIKKGDDLDICITLEGAPREVDCIYGALLISDEAYKANIDINSDGTKNGSSLLVNDIDLIDEFDINPSNYRSGITRDTIQKNIQSIIGEGKGALAIGEMGQEELSLTAFDLPKGRYYLFVGAYSPEKGLVGFTQEEVKIKPRGNSNDDDDTENKDDDTDNDDTDNIDNDQKEGDNHNNDKIYDGDNSSDDNNSVENKENLKEPKKNVRNKEQCKKFITKGSHVKFEFTKKNICVDYVEFDSRKTTGSTIATIEELKDKSAFASTKPEGEIYNYFNVRIGNGEFSNPSNLRNALVGFKVSKDWMDENHISSDLIALQHFNGGKWEVLPTEKIRENKTYIFFEAETPSFSPFAITTEKKVVVIGQEEKENQIPSAVASEEEKSLTDEPVSEVQENGSQIILKITTFFVGLLLILIIGAIIVKKKGPEQ